MPSALGIPTKFGASDTSSWEHHGDEYQKYEVTKATTGKEQMYTVISNN